LNVRFRGNLGKNLKLEVFDIRRLVIFDKKLLEILFKNKVSTSQNEEVDM
jgi:hypothetical protein